MAKSKAEIWAEVHTRALRNFDASQEASYDVRMNCLEDRRFVDVTGAMWEGAVGEQFEGRPKFEVNKIALAVIRIINDYRNNRIGIRFLAKDGAKNDALADTCAGLYRADEQDSCADEAYDNGFEEALKGGVGAWQLVAEYQNEMDPEDERQRIRIKPIYEADSCVYFDVNSKRQDKSDAKHCHLLTGYSIDAYKETWKDDPATWEKPVEQSEFDWCTPDTVYVSEYFEVIEKKQVLHIFAGPLGEEESYTDHELEEEGLAEQLEATGFREVRTRKIKTKRVHKYILSGGGVLEDCGELPGTEIPIVMIFGKRGFVDGVERAQGHVRNAKDAARLKNMQLSRLAEIAALSPIEKPMFEPEQVKGLEQRWADSHLRNYPFELVRSIRNIDGSIAVSGPVGYTKPPQIPQALAALMQITDTDQADLLGNQQGGDKIVSNVSAGAVELVQDRLDMQSYIYVSNFAKGLKRSAEIWLSMAREVYVEEGRKMKVLGDDGEMDSIELYRPMADAEGEIENDLTKATFDVIADIGPSSQTRKQATIRMLTGLLVPTASPEDAKLITAAILMNTEGEGMQDIGAYYRRQLIEMGAVKPTKKELEEMKAEAAAQPQDPNAVFMAAAAEEAQANAAKARAQVVQTVASAELTRAKTVETLSNVDAKAQDQAMKLAEALGGAVQEQTQQI